MKVLADTQGVEIGDADRKELVEKFSIMPPHLEVPAALRRPQDTGFRLFTLTDNLLKVQTRRLEHGVDLFERRFSADGRRAELTHTLKESLGLVLHSSVSSLAIPGTHGAVAAGWEAG